MAGMLLDVANHQTISMNFYSTPMWRTLLATDNFPLILADPIFDWTNQIAINRWMLLPLMSHHQIQTLNFYKWQLNVKNDQLWLVQFQCCSALSSTNEIPVNLCWSSNLYAVEHLQIETRIQWKFTVHFVQMNGIDAKLHLLCTIFVHRLQTSAHDSRSLYGGKWPKMNSRTSSGKSLTLVDAIEANLYHNCLCLNGIK